MGQERNEEGCPNRGGIAGVPVVVEPVVVPVPPVAAPVEVADVQEAVGVAVSYETPSKPPPLECSRGCIAFVISNHMALHTKHLHFLKHFIHRAISDRGRGYSQCTDAGFGRGRP